LSPQFQPISWSEAVESAYFFVGLTCGAVFLFLEAMAGYFLAAEGVFILLWGVVFAPVLAHEGVGDSNRAPENAVGSPVVSRPAPLPSFLSVV
jgi:hypothetical protein